MIEGLKPYPKMKDSGVPWLGRVPEHWDMLPGRVCYRIKKTPNIGLIEHTVLSLSYGRIVVKPEEKLHGLVPASFESYQIVEPGDIVVRPTDLQNDWNSLRFAISRNRGIITSAYLCFRTAAAMTKDYGHLLLHAYDLNKVFYGLGSGLRQNLGWRDFKYLTCLVPPLDEQSAIVHFLTHADRHIRRLIRSKQKLVKLLEEQKQAIIHRAVTRGLDQSVQLKASGVKWLGDIPQHWRVARAGSVSKLISAKAHEQFVEPDGEHICVTARFVSTNGRSFRRCTRNLSPALRGDVLMVMSDLPRGRALARTFLVSDERSYAVNQRVCILRSHGVEPRFLSYVANRHPELLAHDDGFNQTHLPNGAFKIMRLPLPPLEEQSSISDVLDRDTADIDRSSERMSLEIALLAEFRTRLISDVVTGKLDVREAAARLPEESIEGDDPFDDTDTDGEESDDSAAESGPEDGDGG